MGWKYTKEKLEEIIPKSKSWADVCRAFGTSLHGGSQDHIKKKAISYGIDFSHFKTGKGGWNKGLPSPKKRMHQKFLLKKKKAIGKKHIFLEEHLLKLEFQTNVKYA